MRRTKEPRSTQTKIRGNYLRFQTGYVGFRDYYMDFRDPYADIRDHYTGFHDLDEVLEEEKGSLAGTDRKVLLHLLALLAAKRWICQHNVVTVLVLNVGEVFAECVGMNDVRRFDAVGLISGIS